MKLGIIFPVYNEESRLEAGVIKTIEFIKKSIRSECRIYIVDNASCDGTRDIAKKLEENYSNVFYYRIEEKGVGAAFRKGVDISQGDEIVGYMDIDLATDIRHLKQVESIFTKKKIDIVNGSRFNNKSDTSGRKWYRNITSYGLIFLLKTCLGMKSTDAICGFKFFNRKKAIELINESSKESGWFFIIEILLRAEKKNYQIYELPVKWQDDADHSKVDMLKVIKSYLAGIRKLRKEFKKYYL